MFSVWEWLFFKVLAFILCLRLNVNAIDVNPVNLTFCYESNNLLQADCSFLQQKPPGSCTIHNTNSCRAYNFSSWGMDKEEVVTSLEDLDYQVFLSTYYKDKTLALNVSFDSKSEGVHGFYINLYEHKFPGSKKYNRCRLFDLRNSTVDLVSVFSDCLFNIKANHDDNKYFLVTSRGLPTNRVAKFFFKLGTGEEKNVCDWESSVMVLEPALTKKSVIAQFSLASSRFNISRYNVTLEKHGNMMLNGIVADEQTIEAKPGEPSAGIVSFEKVAPGTYYVRIRPDHSDCLKSNCCKTITDTFKIAPGASALAVSLICGLVLLVVILTASIIYVCLKRRAVPSCGPATVFLLYSYDSALHFEAVKALHQFLSKVPGLHVIFDVAEANEMGAPHHWLPTQLHHADFILLVISAGVYDKVEKHQKPTHEHHPWGDLVTPAVFDIVRLDELQKKLVKVLMYGTSETTVPKSLFTRGVTFKLPKHTSRLLHHLFGQQCHSALQCKMRHPHWPDADSERTFQKALESLELASTI